jgi:hypothetical protein
MCADIRCVGSVQGLWGLSQYLRLQQLAAGRRGMECRAPIARLARPACVLTLAGRPLHACMDECSGVRRCRSLHCLCTAYRVFQLGSVHVATSPPLVTVFISVLVHVLFLQEIGFEAEPHIEYQA